jgi:hypothetical protein
VYKDVPEHSVKDVMKLNNFSPAVKLLKKSALAAEVFLRVYDNSEGGLAKEN